MLEDVATLQVHVCQCGDITSVCGMHWRDLQEAGTGHAVIICPSQCGPSWGAWSPGAGELLTGHLQHTTQSVGAEASLGLSRRPALRCDENKHSGYYT